MHLDARFEIAPPVTMVYSLILLNFRKLREPRQQPFKNRLVRRRPTSSGRLCTNRHWPIVGVRSYARVPFRTELFAAWQPDAHQRLPRTTSGECGRQRTPHAVLAFLRHAATCGRSILGAVNRRARLGELYAAVSVRQKPGTIHAISPPYPQRHSRAPNAREMKAQFA
jgi:hypothetical protein